MDVRDTERKRMVENFMTENGLREKEEFGKSHIVPITLGIMPYIFFVVFGSSEKWMEISFVALAVVWLYTIISLPWNIYFMVFNTIKRTRSPQKRVMLGYVKMFSIIFIFLSPILAVKGIFLFKDAYGQYMASFMSNFNHYLFLLIASIPTFKYFFLVDDERYSEDPKESDILSDSGYDVTRMEKMERSIILIYDEILDIKERLSPMEKRISSLNKCERNAFGSLLFSFCSSWIEGLMYICRQSMRTCTLPIRWMGHVISYTLDE